MIGAFIRTITALTRLGTYGLWRFVWISAFISLALGSAMVWGVYSYGGDIGAWLVDFYPFDWGRSGLVALSSWIGGLLTGIIGVVLYKYLILVILSPMMSYVSEKVERYYIGRSEDSFSIIRLVEEFIRGLLLALRNIWKELILVAILFVLGLVFPFIFPITSILTFLVQAYYVGFGALDYFMERRYNVSEARGYAWANKWKCVGVGSAFVLLLFIPIIGWILAPILATVASTEYALDGEG